MGIPSYFSYIVKQHRTIIKKKSPQITINNLYIDSNSIIYDSIKSSTMPINNIDIYEKVYNYICKLINEINPTDCIFIAFDGIPPIAKLNQQKNRRFKASILKNKECNSWDTCNITPGTLFMEQLDNYIKNKIKKKSDYPKIVFSGSDEHGEGEHKLFQHIRNNNILDKNIIIYGLDADLIMLSLNHLEYCKNIYLYRETPEFIKSLDKSLKPNENYILDIPEFSTILSANLYNSCTMPMKDYIFLCFLLGNDFLPHFPSLNIRTQGITVLTETYKKILGNQKLTIISNNKIIWKNLKMLIKELANYEHELFINEYKIREKLKPNDEDTINNIPILLRQIEIYINPYEYGWSDRYYQKLFDISQDDRRLKQIATNYLEGLEWTFLYYSGECQNWRWSYEYHYPPLLKDLFKYIPYFDTSFITRDQNLINSTTQLCYVLPITSHYLLPHDIRNMLISKYSEYYESDMKFNWAYCKYFWESHLTSHEMDINLLEYNLKNYNKI